MSQANDPSRTYTEWLRGRSDDDLAELLRRRPDLMHPPPEDLADLAARATTPSSISRALRQLDAWLLTVLEGLAALHTDSVEPSSNGREALLAELRELLDADRAAPDPVATAVDELLIWGLIWGPSMRLVREARVALGPAPGGLAAPSAHPLSGEAIEAALDSLGDRERALLDRLIWGPPTGRVSNAAQRPADSPIGRLLAARLLRVQDEETVIVPREVAWRLREPRRLLADQPSPTPPRLDRPHDRAPVSGLRSRLAEQAAIATAAELIHDIEACCEWAGAAPIQLLRDGGLGVRDTAGLANQLDTGRHRVAFLLESAQATGLLTPSGQGTLLPSTRYDQWLAEPLAGRWGWLLRAWRGMQRWPTRGIATGHHVLAAESSWAVAPELRITALQQLARLHTGSVVEPDQLVALLGWLRPGWARASWSLSEAVAELWQELQWFGLLGESGITSALLAADPEGLLPEEIAAEFPEPVSEVIIQADLTAVAPGPLTAEVSRALRLLADQESRGAGAVFRFSPESVRRAFDAGWSCEEISQWLATHSVTPIPQPLDYLVTDTARRHGAIRVGAAWCYVRTEDEAQASAILSHPGAQLLGLRAIAPGVLIASAEADEVVSVLHELGLHPAAEDESGHTLTAPDPVRAPAPHQDTPRTPADPTGTVAAVRAREQRRAELAAATTSVISTVRTAHSSGAEVRVEFVRDDGTRTHTTAIPVALGSGTVRLSGADGTWTIPISRIIAAAPA